MDPTKGTGAAAPHRQPGGAVGSETWIGVDGMESGDEHRAGTMAFFNAVNWEALATVASRHRGGDAKARYSEKFSVGQFNMVRRLTFDDGGQDWVARVRLPPEASHASIENYNSDGAFQVEIASMKFLKANSSIPVPEVYAYDSTPSNAVGAAYMLLSYIHGTTASDLSDSRGDSAPWSYGTAEQDAKLRRQMARIQAEMCSFRFDKIGSLYYSDETSSFFIGPDYKTGRGPWATSMEYYRDYADGVMKTAAAASPRGLLQAPSFGLPPMLYYLMTLLAEERSGTFRLVNPDFGAHNILVDDDYNIVGVVDFDAVCAAPIEAAAQFPTLTCMTLDPPGFEETTTNEFALERIALTRPRMEAYKRWLVEFEAELCGGEAFVGERLGSPSAQVFQGLERYAAMFGNEIGRWVEAALKLLRDHYSKSGLGKTTGGSSGDKVPSGCP